MVDCDPYRLEREIVRGIEPVHDQPHRDSADLARTLYDIRNPPAWPGQNVFLWSFEGRARSRCGRMLHHCWHSLGGMGLDHVCCICGAPREHPDPQRKPCVLCGMLADTTHR